MTTDGLAPEGDYGSEYLSWKNWGTIHSFGVLDASYEAYCNAEIKRARLSEISNVLEIGFGDGNFLAYCKIKKWNVVGTEENQELVNLAKSLGYDAFHTSELEKIPVDSFDLIVAFDVLEHIEQKYLYGFLTQVKKWLKKDGIFLARFPNGDSPFGLSVQHGDITHVTTIGRGKVEYFAKNLGFDIQFIGGAAQPIFCGSLLGTLRRLLIVPIKASLEFFFRVLFFSKSRINFISPNLLIVLKQKSIS